MLAGNSDDLDPPWRETTLSGINETNLDFFPQSYYLLRVVFQKKPVPGELGCKHAPAAFCQVVMHGHFTLNGFVCCCLDCVWSAPEPTGRALQKHNTFYLNPVQNHSGESESLPGE